MDYRITEIRPKDGIIKDVHKTILNRPCEILALEEGKLFGTDSSLDVLLNNLAADALERGSTFISLYYGEDVAEEDAQKAASVFQEVCPDAEIAVLPGNQPVYYYIISME